jgi:hypothetical protein
VTVCGWVFGLAQRSPPSSALSTRAVRPAAVAIHSPATPPTATALTVPIDSSFQDRSPRIENSRTPTLPPTATDCPPSANARSARVPGTGLRASRVPVSAASTVTAGLPSAKATSGVPAGDIARAVISASCWWWETSTPVS